MKCLPILPSWHFFQLLDCKTNPCVIQFYFLIDEHLLYTRLPGEQKWDSPDFELVYKMGTKMVNKIVEEKSR